MCVYEGATSSAVMTSENIQVSIMNYMRLEFLAQQDETDEETDTVGARERRALGAAM